jgi:hypothetical protein
VLGKRKKNLDAINPEELRRDKKRLKKFRVMSLKEV